ncbi:hypothetical protein DL93DRAFT_923286 [Clavulina sp. PMI_390]|nr:hypothetical protein DL93DRAFT_923286 [Clavulina sp. PMI_390]
MPQRALNRPSNRLLLSLLRPRVLVPLFSLHDSLQPWRSMITQSSVNNYSAPIFTLYALHTRRLRPPLFLAPCPVSVHDRSAPPPRHSWARAVKRTTSVYPSPILAAFDDELDDGDGLLHPHLCNTTTAIVPRRRRTLNASILSLYHYWLSFH